MQRAYFTLRPLIKDLGIDEPFKLERLKDSWQEVVGESLSKHISPAFLKNGELLIYVDAPVWLQQLKFLKPDILKKLAPFNIDSVRFKIGKIEKSRPKKTKESPFTITPLSKDDKDFIEEQCSSIEDDDLRQTLKTVMEHGLTNKRRPERR